MGTQTNNQNQGLSIEQMEGMNAADSGNIMKMIGRKDDLISRLANDSLGLQNEIKKVRAEVDAIKETLKSVESVVAEKDKTIAELEKQIATSKKGK